MSDNIPFEIQLEIMKRLPVKSLIQFRSVSKTWKSLIGSSRFITEYSSQQQHLLVRYSDSVESIIHTKSPNRSLLTRLFRRSTARVPVPLFEHKYVSVVDDDHHQHKVSMTHVPVSVKMLIYPRLISISHGLVCLYSPSTHVAYLWNISIRKIAAVVVPASANEWGEEYQTALGFGVCRETSDPKIVKIRYVDPLLSSELMTAHLTGIRIPIDPISSQVEVFTLSTGAWRSPYGVNLPRNSISFYLRDELVIDGVFYWLATEWIVTRLIVSFDMTTEEFIEITLPDGLSNINNQISMSNLRDSLVVYGYDHRVINKDFCVWTMGGGVFTKLFTITLNGNAMLRGFRKSGEPIIAIPEEGKRGRLAVVYEPYSNHVDNLRIDGLPFSFKVYPYIETLYLLDHPYIMVYNAI
ncbi:putative F-box domain-containing protein [Helianthus annuus]|uniref:F-box domain-containing protein n=1 Tax=Helianthus annuus TaxID=4232 RepID=A0A251UMV6_HELAN|nr:putative F-box protein At1g32420 [Helianthus annuus]KAF5764814.1 putative F-box domain-containing protein [Helianthus annuus]KAJ0455969.1 putative F-box domain-containing protein [Helianthus annuus]KAJ0473327.1 putative F-box domain-containing protein [Helianthus annuus]KAJ0648909.1 putative F-box domain-containing protein [Helianthus annuus]KAJ0652716.1 putative F-box domain-containing protein [Helianthus annuus]